MTFRLLLNLVLLLTISPAVLVPTYLNYRDNVEAILQQQIDYRERLAVTIAEGIDRYILDSVQAVGADAKIPQFYKFLEGDTNLSEDEVRDVLRAVTIKDSVFVATAGLLTKEGENLLDTDVNYTDRDDFEFEAFQHYSRFQWASYYQNFSAAVSDKQLIIASPIFNRNYRLVGFLRLLIAPSKIQSLMLSITDGVPEVYNIKILSEESTIVARQDHHPQELVSSDEKLTSTIKLSVFPWEIEISEAQASFYKSANRAKQKFYQQLVLMLIVVLIIINVVGWIVTRPLKKLSSVVEDFEINGLTGRIHYVGIREFARLASAFNQMADRIEESIRALHKEHTELGAAQAELGTLNSDLEHRVTLRTQELETKNTELEKLMNRLVQNEKLAAMGSLVAGISHELNTPIGINLTASTDLEDQTRILLKKYNDNSLSRSQMDEYLEFVKKASEILVRNNVRAIELVRSFKEVSIDQSSNRRREFDLKEVVEKTNMTLASLIKSHGFELRANIPEGIEMHSYPGAIEQVVTNWVTNSVKHGFEGMDHGLMLISAEQVGERVEITYTDNGIGIPQQHINKVFDPFFTTKMGQGGSGLGLFILFNLVQGALNGDIELESKQGSGVTFHLSIPRFTKQEDISENSAVSGSDKQPI